jgi:hypothetical protein
MATEDRRAVLRRESEKEVPLALGVVLEHSLNDTMEVVVALQSLGWRLNICRS